MSEKTIQELFCLQHKTILITGATGGLGAAMSRALAEAGANVVVSSRDLKKGQDFAATLPVIGSAVHGAVELDHMDDQSLERGFQAAMEVTGALDVLVNNGNEPLSRDWTNVSGDEFRHQMNNLTGYFLLSRLFRDQIVQRKAQGSLILLGSMYGLVGSYPEAYAGISLASPVSYHAMKGGVVQMNRHLAIYWAQDGVRVNCLCPGPFPPESVPDELVARLTAKSPMRRMGTPAELKGAIVFLASDASSYMTGQNLTIDGGWTAW